MNSLDNVGFHYTASDAICRRAIQCSQSWDLRAKAAESERRLSQATFNDLFKNGWLDLLAPHANVTDGNRWSTLVETARVAARTCASTGWILSLVGAHTSIVRRLPRECIEQLYADGPRQLFATASMSPSSYFAFEEAGVRVSGEWRFSSGIEDATWLILNAPCSNHPDADRTARFLTFVPAKIAEISNPWESSGMAATGSHDIDIPNTLVPHSLVFSLEGVFAQRPMFESSEVLDKATLIPFLTTGIIGPLLGCAEGAVAAFILDAENARPRDVHRDSERFAHSTAQLHSARLLYASLIDRLCDESFCLSITSGTKMLEFKRDRAFMAEQCLQLVQRLVARSGASELTKPSRLQRHWRDIQVMAAHRDVGWYESMQSYGNTILGMGAIH